MNADFYWAGSSVKIFPQAQLAQPLESTFKNYFNSHCEDDKLA